MSNAGADCFSELDSGSFGSIGLSEDEAPIQTATIAEDFFDAERNETFRQTPVYSSVEIPNRRFKELGKRTAVLKEREVIKEEMVDMPDNQSEEEFWQDEEPEEQDSLKEGTQALSTKPESNDFFGEDNQDYVRTQTQSRYNPPNKDYRDLGSIVHIQEEMLVENVEMPQRSDDEDSADDRDLSSGLRNGGIDEKNAGLLDALRKKNKEDDSDQEHSDISASEKKRKPEKKMKNHMPANVVLEQKLKELASKNKNVLNQEVIIPDELGGEDALRLIGLDKRSPDRDRERKPKTAKAEASSKPKVEESLTKDKPRKDKKRYDSDDFDTADALSFLNRSKRELVPVKPRESKGPQQVTSRDARSPSKPRSTTSKKMTSSSATRSSSKKETCCGNSLSRLSQAASTTDNLINSSGSQRPRNEKQNSSARSSSV